MPLMRPKAEIHLCLIISNGDPMASFCFRLELYAPASMYTGYLRHV